MGLPVRRLGREIARGTEGSIHPVQGEPTLYGKVLLKPTDERRRKIEAMLSSGSERLRNFCAWPLEPLREGNGRISGFIMPRAKGSFEWHTLAGTQSRLQALPDVDYRFLVACSANLARAFACLHEHRIVIGDVNERSPLVAKDATVTLVDCDSFQFERAGRLFGCEVASPHFVPPEFQKVASFRGLRREERHDLFGLAVLLFQMLFFGRHPFAGVPTSPDMPMPTIEEAIHQYRYAYARPAGTRGFYPPPGTMPVEAVGEECAALFDAAFGKTERPKAALWAQALDRLIARMKRCPANPSHWMAVAVCPFCAIEGSTGRPLFIGGLASGGVGLVFVDATAITALWRAIQSQPAPEAPSPLPTALIAAIPDTKGIIAAIIRTAIGAIAVVGGFLLASTQHQAWFAFIGIIAGLVVLTVNRKERSAAKARRQQAVKRRDSLVQEWCRAADGALFTELLARLTLARDELADVPKSYRNALVEAERSRRADQMEDHLARKRIDRGSIKGIGPGRAATLKSFGIETAADIDKRRVAAVPGFGPTRTQALLDFRAGMERTFVFDSKRPVSPAKIAAIDARFRSRQAALVAMLKAGPTDLADAARRCREEGARLIPLIEAARLEARAI